MNTNMLKSIATTSPTAEGMFYCFSFRERQHKAPMKLNRFKAQLVGSGIKVDDKAFLRVFEELEKLGTGELVKGRGGVPIRFNWKAKISDVGRAALGDTTATRKELPARVVVSKPKAVAVKPISVARVSLKTTIGNKTIEADMDINSFLEFIKAAS
jgi:hypothetical protein